MSKYRKVEDRLGINRNSRAYKNGYTAAKIADTVTSVIAPAKGAARLAMKLGVKGTAKLGVKQAGRQAVSQASSTGARQVRNATAVSRKSVTSVGRAVSNSAPTTKRAAGVGNFRAASASGGRAIENLKLSGRNVLGAPGDPAIDAARGARRQEGHFDVVAHGTPSSVFDDVGGSMTSGELANVVRSTPSWQNQPVRLLACETGCTSGTFAQNLANDLAVPVRAPTAKFYVNSRGKIINDPGGRWLVYLPIID
ncbi:hypothetical protein [Tessaracoccus caeni]|uniref:hypothetical protein n=1 Tax=Tessaracoccus caeni TaxID=3031239 RepID=UPI0023DC2F8E|nr:hypothetical protein [Tessaracoccus caeni]MDF1488276.1 hypothetical protein [Tessaracoccus caeni]